MPRLRTDRRCSTSLEFAIVVIPFLILVLGTMEVGYDFFVMSALDNAVQVAARSVQVGSVSGSAKGSALAAWVAGQVCPALGKLLSCNGLFVNITTIPSSPGSNYYTYITANAPSLASLASSSNAVCTGSGGQMMLLRAYYLSPTFLGFLVPGWSQPSPLQNLARVHVTYASAGFVNEYFGGGQPGC